MWRYYYDSYYGKCLKFTFSCGGNQNNFKTLHECENYCKVKHYKSDNTLVASNPFYVKAITGSQKPDYSSCHLPKKTGHCFRNIWRYYYDSTIGKCEKFIYTGCGGNLNNFERLQDCQKVCIAHVHDLPKVTPTPPKQDINVCLLSKVRGNCHKSIWRYYFDKSTQKCRKFIYSGCGENGNNFKRIIDCKVRCEVTVKPTTPNPNINVCFLSKEQGRCYKRIWRYYFDKKTHRCEKFVYTGCGGNGNNFKRLIDCNKRCDVQQTQPPIVTPTPPKSDYNSCYLPKEKGRCSKSIWRYYYDSNIGKCKKFIYTGCGGNLNNFERLQDCENVCTDHIPKYKEVTPTPPKVEYSSCYLPKEKGHCYRSISRYYYNSKIRKCETFVYTGCGGNLNNFEALQDCENVCLNHVPDSNELEDKDTGKNSEGEKSMVELLPYLESLHKIYYGGNKGGQHKSQITIDWGIVLEGWRRQFLGEPQLTTYYLKVPKEISPETACKFEKTYGTCSQELKRYFYNSIISKCESFIYTGCAGNPNNFLSQSRCDRICAKSISQKTVLQSGKYIFPPIVEANDPQKQEGCYLGREVGYCNSYLERYYFDTNLGRCVQFIYTGCGGNTNNFNSYKKCNSLCGGSAERPIKVCRLEKNIGYCHDQIDKYFFNTHTRKCEKFIYSGCGGNKNNFDNETECNETCTQKGSPLIKDKHGLINEPGHGLISVPEKGLNSGTEHVLFSGPEHGLTSGAEHVLISGPEHGLTSGPGMG
nr:papilin-like [Lepeophtheirus salmonis]